MAGNTVIRHGKARIELRGFEDLARRLNRVGGDAAEATFEVFARATQRVYAKSQQLVPVDKGALKASGRISKPRISKRSGFGGHKGGVITASVNYGGSVLKRLAPGEPEIYGIVVHEDPNGSGYKFLERPMTQEKGAVMRELAARIAAKVSRP